MQQARVRDSWRPWMSGGHIELCEIVSVFTMIYVSIIFLLRFKGELSLDMIYGYGVKGQQDRKLVVSKQLNEFQTCDCEGPCERLDHQHISVPYAASLLLPSLTNFVTISVRHVPAWVPYISFNPLEQIGRTLCQEVLHEPMRFVKESIVCNGLGTVIISQS
jgi:hypothetical protein